MKSRKQVAVIFSRLITKKLCVTKSAFAKMVKTDRQRIQSYCNGAFYPDYAFFARAKEAGVDIQEFF